MSTQLPTWSVYKWLDLDQRESIHLKWCKKHSKDPNSELHVNEFFDEMALVPEPVDGEIKPKPAPRAKPVPGRAPGRPKKTPTDEVKIKRPLGRPRKVLT